jgi:hypothetical protein
MISYKKMNWSIIFIIYISLNIKIIGVASQACPSQVVFETCMTGARQTFNNCPLQDYKCRCQRQREVVMCYQNCPGNVGKASDEGQVSIWCSYVQ